MLKNNNAVYRQDNNLKYRGTGLCFKMLSLSLISFIISLPFNGIEWNIFDISRFEIKITMITFSFLFLAWLSYSFRFPRKRAKEEKLLYILAIFYAASQFTSLVNSKYPLETI